VHSADERALEHVEAAKKRKEQRLLLPDYLLKRLRGYLDAEVDVIRKICPWRRDQQPSFIRLTPFSV
jgi:hypothetical protein